MSIIGVIGVQMCKGLLYFFGSFPQTVVKSFVEVVKFLFDLPGTSGQYLLSERFTQDPLENYFSRQRARGGRCDNPTVGSCLEAAQSIRVQRSLALQPVRGNCSRKRRLFSGKEEIDDTPLRKRSRSNKQPDNQ